MTDIRSVCQGRRPSTLACDGHLLTSVATHRWTVTTKTAALVTSGCSAQTVDQSRRRCSHSRFVVDASTRRPVSSAARRHVVATCHAHTGRHRRSPPSSRRTAPTRPPTPASPNSVRRSRRVRAEPATSRCVDAVAERR